MPKQCLLPKKSMDYRWRIVAYKQGSNTKHIAALFDLTGFGSQEKNEYLRERLFMLRDSIMRPEQILGFSDAGTFVAGNSWWGIEVDTEPEFNEYGEVGP